jgi:hypothetical protein
MSFSFLELIWDSTIGPWGGWTRLNDSCAGGGVRLTLYPVACVDDELVWILDVSWTGGSAFTALSVECGHGMIFGPLAINPPACPGAEINVFVSWPGSLPP